MNPLYDLEIIDSAVLSGEIDDAMNLIEKKIRNLDSAVNVSKNGKLRSHLRVLQSIEDFLMGKTGIDALKEIMRSNFIYGVEEKDGFIENFTYHLYYAADRYNVRFPEFNGKRCGDL